MFEKWRRKWNTGYFWKDRKKRKKENTSRLKKLPYHTYLGGMVPLDYDVTRQMKYVMGKVDAEIEDFLERAETDQYNEGSFLDKYVEAYFNLVRNDLKKQKLNHQHMIQGLDILKGSHITKIQATKKAIKDLDQSGQDEMEEEKG